MNLGKLLIAGRSVMGGRRQVSYHVVGGAFLPKFVSPKNPFVPPAQPEAPPAPVAPVPRQGAAVVATEKRPRASKTPPPAAGSHRQSWLGKFKPLSFWRGPAVAEPQKSQSPKQTELSLDRVKVVHNDLSDVDVEVVPIKSRTTPEAAEPIPARGGDAWSRLGAKIFGVRAA